MTTSSASNTIQAIKTTQPTTDRLFSASYAIISVIDTLYERLKTPPGANRAVRLLLNLILKIRALQILYLIPQLILSSKRTELSMLLPSDSKIMTGSHRIGSAAFFSFISPTALTRVTGTYISASRRWLLCLTQKKKLLNRYFRDTA